MKAFVACPHGVNFDTFFTPENIALAESLGEICWKEGKKKLTADDIDARIADCDTYITFWGSPKLDEEILARAPKLKLHTHLCGTVVPVTSEAEWERGVRVICGNDWFARSVAEGTVAYILAALRDIPYFSTMLKGGEWKKQTDTNIGLSGRKVGIVSYGTIARYLVPLLKPFGCDISVYDIKPLPKEDVKKYGLTQVSLEELFSESDIITLHTPLIDATYHLIGKELLERIRPGALFVNTSRGAVVDEAALVEELAKGRFRAFLDVYENEPVKVGNPLLELDNVIMMPHMAGPTVDLRQVITKNLLLESAGFIDRGEPLAHEVLRARVEQMSRR